MGPSLFVKPGCLRARALPCVSHSGGRILDKPLSPIPLWKPQASLTPLPREITLLGFVGVVF